MRVVIHEIFKLYWVHPIGHFYFHKLSNSSDHLWLILTGLSENVAILLPRENLVTVQSFRDWSDSDWVVHCIILIRPNFHLPLCIDPDHIALNLKNAGPFVD